MDGREADSEADREARRQARRQARSEAKDISNNTETLQYTNGYYDSFFRGERFGAPNWDELVTISLPRWSAEETDPSFDPSRQPEPKAREEFSRHRRTDDGEGMAIGSIVSRRLDALGIEIGRILGAGSQGLAIAVKLGGQDLVVKSTSSRDLAPTSLEIWTMREMMGAKHVVQVSVNVYGAPGWIPEPPWTYTPLGDALSSCILFYDFV